MYKFTDTNFTPAQRRNYTFLRFLYNFAGWFAVASIVLPFVFVSINYFMEGVFYKDISVKIPWFWIIIGALVLWVVLRGFTSNRCLNCFKFNALEEQSETIVSDWSKYGLEKTKIDKGGLQIMAVKQLKCKKCAFECQQITTRTGATNGIARMSRDIKRGGKSRLSGETYTSWWRRNK
jgi:hypothetical protein